MGNSKEPQQSESGGVLVPPQVTFGSSWPIIHLLSQEVQTLPINIWWAHLNPNTQARKLLDTLQLGIVAVNKVLLDLQQQNVRKSRQAIALKGDRGIHIGYSPVREFFCVESGHPDQYRMGIVIPRSDRLIAVMGLWNLRKQEFTPAERGNLTLVVGYTTLGNVSQDHPGVKVAAIGPYAAPWPNM